MQDSLVRDPIWQRMYLAPSYTTGATEHVYALHVLAEILMGAPEGRLYQQLVVQKQLATALDIVYLPDSMCITEFTLQITPAPGVETAVQEQAIDHTLAAIVAKGVSRAEVQWAQHRLHRHASLARTHDSTGAELLGVALTTGRALVEVQQWRDRIAAVTREQVEAAAQAVLRTEWSVTGVLLPAAADNAASGERLRTAK